jgi:hypothetical protein
MSSRLSLAALTVVLMALPSFAALSANAVTLNVSQSSKQNTQINSRRSDGMADKTISRVQMLDIECRTLGGAGAEPAILRWFFVSKDALDGKFEYHSIGSEDVTMRSNAPTKITAKADPMERNQFVRSEGDRRIQVTAATLPVGWIVMLCQNGNIVKQTASTPGLLEWMKRNPPPKPKD